MPKTKLTLVQKSLLFAVLNAITAVVAYVSGEHYHLPFWAGPLFPIVSTVVCLLVAWGAVYGPRRVREWIAAHP